MKKKQPFTLLLIMTVTALFTACTQPGPEESEGITSLNMSVSASAATRTTENTRAARSYTGTLTITNLESGEITSEHWYAVINDETLEAVSTKTAALSPGTYDLSLVLTRDHHTYAGEVSGQVITRGNNNVNIILNPVIGETTVNTNLTQSAYLRLSYNSIDFTSLSNPQIDVKVDGTSQGMFKINKSTGLSDLFLELAPGNYTIELELFDDMILVGTGRKECAVSPGESITIDLFPLYGEAQASLTIEGGDAPFTFILPPEVVAEARVLQNLKAELKLTSAKNGTRETELTFSNYAEGKIKAEHIFTDFYYDTVSLELTLWDKKDTKNYIGKGLISGITLTDQPQPVTMDLKLRRRALMQGSLMAVVGVNVFDENNFPLADTNIYINGALTGITGSADFSTAGYLKLYLKQEKSYTITAFNPAGQNLGSVVLKDVMALDVRNVDIKADMTGYQNPENKNIYAAIDSVMSWHESKTLTENMGGHLVTVSSESENIFISNIAILYENSHFWLGLTDEHSEGEWRWVNEEPMVYSNWLDAQPDNSGNDEHFAHMYPQPNSGWNDLPVSHTTLQTKPMLEFDIQ